MYYKYLLDKYLIPLIKNKPLLNFVCNDMDNALTVEELEKLIDLSAKFDEVETTALLLEYKNKHFEYANPLNEFNLGDYPNDVLDNNLGSSK